MIYIHFCFFVEKTHQKKHLYLSVGGVANQLLQLLPSYEKIDDLNISIVTTNPGKHLMMLHKLMVADTQLFF